MKKFAIFIIIGSLLSGFFLSGILGVPLNTNIAFAQDGPPPPPGSTTNSDGNTVVPTEEEEPSQGSPIQTPEPASLFACSFEFNAANLVNCVGAVLYIPYYITQVIAAVSGMFLDVMIDYSTQGASYESGFVSEGWKIIRDITNIGFIFALLYIAISTIVGQGSAKSTLVWVIIMAMVVNFSFFTTRVVIDASNILARVFYQNINVQDANSDPNETTKSITAALISKVNIQNIENDVSASLQDQPNAMDEWKIALAGILITFLVIIVNLVMIFVFFSIAMLFVGRVIGLWFSIIASPLAFLSIAFPGGKSWKRIGWDSWSSDLIGTAFLAPVFLFFIYLIILFLGTGFLTDAMSGGTTLSSVLVGIIVPFAFFMTLLITAKNISSDLAGQIASTVTGYLNTAMLAVGGVAGGAALAGVGIAGGAVAGVAGRAIARKGASTLANNATATGFKGKAARFAGRSMSSTGRGINSVNWDPRSNKITSGLLNQVASASGSKMPTFGQEFGKKYASGQGSSDLRANLGEKFQKKKQARADELADAVATHGKVPGTSTTYKQNLENATDTQDEFMAKFGHVLESLDTKIKEESMNMRTANQALQAAKESGDPGLIAKAQADQVAALGKYNDAKDTKEDFANGGTVNVDGVDYNPQVIDNNGNPRDFNQIKEDVKKAQSTQTKATTEARNFYAEEIRNTKAPEQVLDAILSGGGSIGQYKKASRAVRNKAKEEAAKPPTNETIT